MSINELLNELCPDGVEFVKIWEVTAWNKKFSGVAKEMQRKVILYPSVFAKVFDDIEDSTGSVRLLATGIKDEERWTTEEKAGDNLCEGEIVAIPGGGTPNVKYYNGKFVTSDNRIATSLDTNVLSNKFLYYLLSNKIKEITKFYRGASIQHPSMKDILNIEIPLPPIGIQTKIVQVLDQFEKLTAELTAELKCRKLQYKYYRDKLLTFDEKDVEFVKLGDCCEISRGKVYSKKYLAEHMGEYPVYSSQTTNDGILGEIGTYDYDGKFLTWTTDGAYAGTVFYRQGKFSITNVCGLISCSNPNLTLKFLYYWLTIEAPKHVHQGMGNPKLMSNQMANIKIPLPSIETQTKIATILDQFETLTTSLQSGIPAEIEARRKQYEYYRNKLLTFKRKES